MHMIYMWLLIAGATFLAEIGHPGLFLFLAISIGALGAAGVAAVSSLAVLQLIGFMLASISSFCFLKYYVTTHKSHYTSNAHALIGMRGYVTENITANNAGRVRVKSEEWLARGLGNAELLAGSSVRVVRIDRATLIVELHHHT